MKNILLFGLSLVFAGQLVADESAWKPLFNGHDLSGWADVNTSPETWWVEDGELRCKGLPIGVMRSAQQYENFILEIEWMHETAGVKARLIPRRLFPRVSKFRCWKTNSIRSTTGFEVT